jgi:hypothetical protein
MPLTGKQCDSIILMSQVVFKCGIKQKRKHSL